MNSNARLIEDGGEVFCDVLRGAILGSPPRIEHFGSLRCSKCKTRQSMDLVWMGATFGRGGGRVGLAAPGLADLICGNCQASHKAGIFFSIEGQTPEQRRVRICLIDSAVSIATPETPGGVSFYLDQAVRAKAGGARSAAAAMYRAALDHMLFDQGYQDGMTGKKLADLKDAVSAKTAPEWAMRLDPEELDALKNIGNGAIHTNDGDVTRQMAIDETALLAVEAVFESVLRAVYDEPAERAARLKGLKTIASTLTPSKKAKT